MYPSLPHQMKLMSECSKLYMLFLDHIQHFCRFSIHNRELLLYRVRDDERSGLLRICNPH